MSPLALLLWSAFLALSLALMWAMFRPTVVTATFKGYSSAFRSAPGHLVYRGFATVQGQRYAFETFVVSVATTPNLDFKLKSKAPPALRLSVLESYSDCLSMRLLAGMLRFRRRGATPSWNREKLSFVAVALSSIPVASGGMLEARQGRLVAKWTRHLTQQEFSKQPVGEVAATVARAELVLARLAGDLAAPGHEHPSGAL